MARAWCIPRPGHGAEDYATGLKYGLPTLSPVDAGGRFTAERKLPTSCTGWGCSRPTRRLSATCRRMGRCTSRVRGASLRTLLAVQATGDFARDRAVVRDGGQALRGGTHAAHATLACDRPGEVGAEPWGKGVSSRWFRADPTGAVSRQRSWGVPIPAFGCKGCGTMLLSGTSVRHVRDLFRREGADSWYSRPVEELMPPGASCASCGGTDFEKQYDILDVWFESG